MKYFILIFIYISLFANKYEKGKDIFFQNSCSSCHGINAEGSSNNPKLANKAQAYIIKKLKKFQKGKANSQAGEIMFEFSRRLSDNDLENVSYFLSNHKKDNSTKYEISDDLLGGLN